MNAFEYRGTDKSGKKVDGRIEAPNEGEARMLLRSQGVRPHRVTQLGTFSGEWFGFLRGRKKVSTRALMQFIHQLHILIASGLPLVQSLDILSERYSSRFTTQTLGRIILDIKERLQKRIPLAECFAAQGVVFPPFFIAMTQTIGGPPESLESLDLILTRVLKYWEKEQKTSQLAALSIIAPFIIVSVFIAFGFFVVTVIGLDSSSPLIEAIAYSLGFVRRHIGFLLVATVIMTYLSFRYFSLPEGRAVRDRIAFRNPLLKSAVQSFQVIKFSRMMQMLLVCGIELSGALEMARLNCNNILMEQIVNRLQSEVEAGHTLAAILGRVQVFPRAAVQIIAGGEHKDKLGAAFGQVARLMESEIETDLGRISTSPLLWLVVALFFALALAIEGIVLIAGVR